MKYQLLCSISRSTILAAVKNEVKNYKPRLIVARVRYLLLSSRCPSVAAARLSYPGVSATALAAFEQPLSILSYSTLFDNKSIFWHFTRLILVTSSNPTLETLMSYLGQVNRRLNRWIWLGVRCFKKELMVNYSVFERYSSSFVTQNDHQTRTLTHQNNPACLLIKSVF